MCKISDSDSCTFCESAVETIEHLMFDCPHVLALWHDMAAWLAPCLDITDLINARNIILGTFSNDLINLLMLRTKYYVYACKFSECKPHVLGLIAAIKHEYRIEKVIAKNRPSARDRINNKWITIIQLVDS